MYPIDLLEEHPKSSPFFQTKNGIQTNAFPMLARLYTSVMKWEQCTRLKAKFEKTRFPAEKVNYYYLLIYWS